MSSSSSSKSKASTKSPARSSLGGSSSSSLPSSSSVSDEQSNTSPLTRLVVDDLGNNQIAKTQSARRSVCYLNSKTMQNNDISVGDIVILCNDDASQQHHHHMCIGVAWPVKKMLSNHIQMDAIQRDNCNVGIGAHVTIHKSPFISVPFLSSNNKSNGTKNSINTTLNAYSIEVECITESSKQYIEQLSKFGMLSSLITSQISGCYFIIGNSFTCQLNGRNIRFKLVSFQWQSSTSLQSSSPVSSSNTLVQELNNLSIVDNNNNEIESKYKYIVKITDSTIINIIKSKTQETNIKQQQQEKEKENNNNNNNNIGYHSIGGLQNQVKQVKELIQLSFEKGDILSQFGVKPPRGVLLYGPPGTGKTLLARIVAKESKCSLYTMNGADVLDKYYGVTEKTIQGIFNEASLNSPSIIFIDELDALCPKRDDNSSEVEKRVVGCLLTLMDGIDSASKVLVIGCTNRPDSIDVALRRPGRFDREIEIGIPNVESREQILSIFLSKIPNQLTKQDIALVASKSHGFVGADIESLCKEAAMKCFHRYIELVNKPGMKVTEENTVQVTMEDMLDSLLIVKPSSMREVVVEVPKVRWDDIGGQHDVKSKLREAVEWPLKHPQAFARMGIRPPKGVLLYGPPGCSKTLMAKALATESGLNFIAVKGPELLSKWVGESERAVRDIFKKARQNSPSILFFDEIDGLAVSRSGEGSGAVERVVSQLLTEMDGIQPLTNVTIIAATNRPDIIDKAILRAGRIDRILYISPPDFEARKEIFNIHLKRVPHDQDIDVNELSQLSEGYSGAEVTSICKEASICAMKENINVEKISLRHFKQALANVKKGITQEMLDFYANYQKQSSLQNL